MICAEWLVAAKEKEYLFQIHLMRPNNDHFEFSDVEYLEQSR